MLKRVTEATLLYFALQITALPALSDVYRWVDASGGVHYSDRKPQDVESTLIKISKTSHPAENAEKSIGERIDALQDKEQIEKLKARQKQEIAVSEKNTTEYCKSVKANIDTLANNARIKIKGEDGELRYLTAEEIVEQRKSRQQLFNEKCGTYQP
jgi:outer membrane PBP1 activator LpoA protein